MFKKKKNIHGLCVFLLFHFYGLQELEVQQSTQHQTVRATIAHQDTLLESLAAY